MTGVADLRGEDLERFHVWRGLGLSEASALRQVVEDGAAGDGFDQMVRTFRGMGLSESAAQIAAVGRDGSESAARRGFAQVDKPAQAAPAGSAFEERLQRLESRQKRLDEATRRLKK